jgi:hypothetical protein
MRFAGRSVHAAAFVRFGNTDLFVTPAKAGALNFFLALHSLSLDCGLRGIAISDLSGASLGENCLNKERSFRRKPQSRIIMALDAGLRRRHEQISASPGGLHLPVFKSSQNSNCSASENSVVYARCQLPTTARNGLLLNAVIQPGSLLYHEGNTEKRAVVPCLRINVSVPLEKKLHGTGVFSRTA